MVEALELFYVRMTYSGAMWAYECMCYTGVIQGLINFFFGAS